MRNGFSIPIFGLGTWELLGEKCKKAVKIALELGYNHIDTAEVYNNQKEIGEAIKEVEREDLFITSKVPGEKLHYYDVIKSCEQTLRELKTSYLDLFLIHWPNFRISLEETLEAMKKLCKEEKVRSIGVSNFDLSLMKRTLDLESEEVLIVTNQVEFHPYSHEEKLLNFCNENKVIFTAYSPLARGKVLRDKIIQGLSEKYGRTKAQIALRWALQKGTVVIPKATSEEHLKENMKIFDWKISEEDMKKIDSLSRKRY